MLAFIAMLAGASWWGWERSAVEAQMLAESSTPIAGPIAESSIRLQEIGAAQDRFVQTILAIISLIGAGFFVLVGFNAWQSNRNFDRESTMIRDYAQSQIDRAVESVKPDLDKFVAERARTMLESVNHAAAKANLENQQYWEIRRAEIDRSEQESLRRFRDLEQTQAQYGLERGRSLLSTIQDDSLDMAIRGRAASFLILTGCQTLWSARFLFQPARSVAIREALGHLYEASAFLRKGHDPDHMLYWRRAPDKQDIAIGNTLEMLSGAGLVADEREALNRWLEELPKSLREFWRP